MDASGLVLSSLVLSRLISSYLVMSCLVVSCLVLSCLVLSCLVLSCLVLSCLVLSCLSCPFMSCACLVLSNLGLSCLVFGPLFSCLVLSFRTHIIDTLGPGEPVIPVDDDAIGSKNGEKHNPIGYNFRATLHYSFPNCSEKIGVLSLVQKQGIDELKRYNY
jgi:hypothetical protein